MHLRIPRARQSGRQVTATSVMSAEATVPVALLNVQVWSGALGWNTTATAYVHAMPKLA